MEWIKCSDRLPSPTDLDNSPNVLITDGKIVSIGWYEAYAEEIDENDKLWPEEMLWHDLGKSLHVNYNGWPDVIYWMPLPEPPKED